MKFFLTKKESGELHDFEMAGENAIDLLLGATLGAYFGSSINHSTFGIEQAFALVFFLASLWMFVFVVKVACRGLTKKHYGYAAMFLGLTVAWTFSVRFTLSSIAGENTLFFQAVMIAWIISYLMLVTFYLVPSFFADE